MTDEPVPVVAPQLIRRVGSLYRVEEVDFGATTYDALGELRAAPSDPERDARREAYRADQRRKAARALDRLFDARRDGLTGAAYDVVGERYIEAVGDYVLSRLHHCGVALDAVERTLGPSARRDVAESIDPCAGGRCSDPEAHAEGAHDV